MKNSIHKFAGGLGFVCILIFLISTILVSIFGSAETIALIKSFILYSIGLLILSLLVAGGSGMSLLGKRQDSLALAKQKRGPIAFMTSLLVLLPSAFFLSRWSATTSFGTAYVIVQSIEILASFVVITMVGLNIRDGMILTGHILPAGDKNSSKTPSIDERENGPLVAMSIPNLIDSSGNKLAQKPVAALCRCGASKNKPYCDGSHNDISFDSSRSRDESKNKIMVFEGKEITVHYNRLLCSHAAECGKRQKTAFDSSRKPWIIPDNANAKQIKDVVSACPSGALRYSESDGEAQHIEEGITGIQIEKNGPYRVAGIPLLTSDLAKGATPTKYVLCRCGASKNKPYCDGSHVDINWKDN